MSWRQGASVGRTLYAQNVLVGLMDTPELAKQVVDAMNAEEVIETARQEMERQISFERQACKDTCKAAEQRVEALALELQERIQERDGWKAAEQIAQGELKAANQHMVILQKDLGEERREHRGTREQLTKLQEQYDALSEQAHQSAHQVALLTVQRDEQIQESNRWKASAQHLEGQVRAHRQAHQETSADARAVLEACGAQADVDEGRDPIEAARAVRDSLNSTTDHAIALERDRDEWKRRFEAILGTSHALGEQVGVLLGQLRRATLEPCPACGPGECTPSCPEREWRYSKADAGA